MACGLDCPSTGSANPATVFCDCFRMLLHTPSNNPDPDKFPFETRVIGIQAIREDRAPFRPDPWISIQVEYEDYRTEGAYCGNSLSGPRAEDKWFEGQGEAIASERHEIDRKMGIAPRVEQPRGRWGR